MAAKTIVEKALESTSNVGRYKNEILTEISGDRKVDVRFYRGRKSGFLVNQATEWMENNESAGVIVLQGGLNDILKVSADQ